MSNVRIGDDMIAHDKTPPKLLKALAVIADTMHQEFAIEPWIASPDKSKQSCILCSLTVRDFLHEIGFGDAVVRPCCFYIDAHRGKKQLHSLAIGHPEDRPKEEWRWIGHMACVVPSAQTLIDTTLFQAKREAWPELPGMAAVYYAPGVFQTEKYHGLSGIAGMLREEGDYWCRAVWFDKPSNDWRQAGDAKDTSRRKRIIALMAERFQPWRDY